MTDEALSNKPENYEPVTINFKAYTKYLETHGPERAQGYFDALNDMHNNIEGLFYQYGQGEYFLSNSSQRVYTRLMKFKSETNHLLEQIQKPRNIEEVSSKEINSPN